MCIEGTKLVGCLLKYTGYCQQPIIYPSMTLPLLFSMTGSQAHVVQKILPLGFSIKVDRTASFKKWRRKRGKIGREQEGKTEGANQEGFSYYYWHQRMSSCQQQPPAQEPSAKQPQAACLEQVTQKCHKMLALLKKNRHAWLFLQPVDPIALGIPHYTEAIKCPMDLQTVQQNLNGKKYLSLLQFYADIELIISNSLEFNKGSQQLKELTLKFEQYFHKIRAEPHLSSTASDTAYLIRPEHIHKPSPAATHRAVDLNIRKQLAIKLKRLTRDELAKLVASIQDETNPIKELNLETLPQAQIRAIQRYFQSRQQAKQPIVAPTDKKPTEKQQNSEQSSFHSDSDS